MTYNAQWQASNQARAAIYRWFAELFAKELTPMNLERLQTHYDSMHQAFSDLGLAQESHRLHLAIQHLQHLPASDRTLELAADFAQMFLLSGRDSAPPYASYYLDKDQMLYGKPAEQMGDFLSQHALSLHPDFREPKDHISVYLQVMSVWNKAQLDTEHDMDEMLRAQGAFLNDALLSWLAKFNERCQTIPVKTDVYPALTTLLLEFVQKDKQALLA